MSSDHFQLALLKWVIAPVMTFLLLLLLLFIPYGMWRELTNDSLFVKLSKYDWECTSKYEHKVMDGRAWTTRVDCSMYQLKEQK